MARRPFLDIGLFPHLEPLTAAAAEIAAEADRVRSHLAAVEDPRTRTGAWRALPFRVEPDDASVFPESVCAAHRALAPITTELVESIDGVEAYSFSALAPASSIARHRHHRPFVTAALCLRGGQGAAITVGDERRPYVDGSWVIFDYTLPHSVENLGPEDRVVLLVLLPDPRTASRIQAFRGT